MQSAMRTGRKRNFPGDVLSAPCGCTLFSLPSLLFPLVPFWAHASCRRQAWLELVSYHAPFYTLSYSPYYCTIAIPIRQLFSLFLYILLNFTLFYFSGNKLATCKGNKIAARSPQTHLQFASFEWSRWKGWGGDEVTLDSVWQFANNLLK